MGDPVFTDTHVHFDESVTPDEAAALVRRAHAAGVTRLVAVGGSPAMNAAALRMAAEYPDRVRAAIGLDRHLGAHDGDLGGIERLVAETPAGRIVALGETGLDYHHDPGTAAAQEQLMRRHLQLAAALRLPVVVHTRDADVPTLDLLSEHAGAWRGDPERIGVIHCFTGGAAFAARLLDLGFFISFSGIVTFRNADPLREVARGIPADRLLIETDTPYLAPVPHRGRPNEPAFLTSVAARLAEIRGVSVDDLARVTTGNASRLFDARGDNATSGRGSMSDDPVIDESALNKLRQLGGNAFLAQMIDAFFTVANRSCSEARAGLANGDLEPVQRMGHSLASSAQTVGAMPLRALAKKVELCAREKRADALPALLDEFERTYAGVKERLAGIRAGLV